MNLLGWPRRFYALLGANLDVIGVAVALVVAQPLVPTGHLLARADLAPWTTLAVSLVALARGGPLGRGPHPRLTARQSTMGALQRRVALALVAPTLLAWYNFGLAVTQDNLWPALVLSAVVTVLLVLGRGAGETAWDPPGISGARLWGFGSGAAITLAMALAWNSRVDLPVFLSAVWQAGLLSLQFLCVGLAAGRSANLRQRLTAGRRDGGRVWPTSFAMVLAAVGPGLGFLVLSLAFTRVAGHGLNFGEAYVATIFVCSWASILWRAPPAVAVGVMLHEVVPAGGADPQPETSAVGFDRPPEGALRFSPLLLRRTRAVHPWIVPVRRSRIGDLDDPVVPLWAPPPTFPPSHVLGEAAFEPDPLTGAPQWEILTVRLGGTSDTMSVTEDEAQTRRIVVLRPFPRVGGGRVRQATYRWDTTIPAESLQVLDATTVMCQLIDGDVIVLSAEGVARAYEIEIGAPIEGDAELASYRAPQIEDYVKVRG